MKTPVVSPKCVGLIATTLFLTTNAFGRNLDVDAQVKDIAQRCNAIEKQLDRSFRYLLATKNKEGGDETQQAWLNPAGDCLKVSVDDTVRKNRNLTEIFLDNFVVFVLEHHGFFLPIRSYSGT